MHRNTPGLAVVREASRGAVLGGFVTRASILIRRAPCQQPFFPRRLIHSDGSAEDLAFGFPCVDRLQHFFGREPLLQLRMRRVSRRSPELATPRAGVRPAFSTTHVRGRRRPSRSGIRRPLVAAAAVEVLDPIRLLVVQTELLKPDGNLCSFCVPTASRLLSRPPHRGQAERGQATGSEPVCPVQRRRQSPRYTLFR
jgi:hypothetical protein